MLEGRDCGTLAAPEVGEFEKAWDELECRIQIPREWLRYFEMRGVVPTMAGDRRRFPRFYCHVRAVLHYRQTLPAVPRSEGRHLVLTRDVSREGVCFLHAEPLFPHERMPLDLPGGRRVQIEVFRCKRHNQRCYEIGARMAKPSSELVADEQVSAEGRSAR